MDAGRTPLHYNHILLALKYKNPIEVIKYLAERVDTNQAKINFEYILTIAIVAGASLDTIKYLIDKWLDISYVNSKGENTILYVIRAGGSVDVIEYLVSKGVNPHHVNNNGENALNYAFKNLKCKTHGEKKFHIIFLPINGCPAS